MTWLHWFRRRAPLAERLKLYTLKEDATPPPPDPRLIKIYRPT
jgi:hypothetical protein